MLSTEWSYQLAHIRIIINIVSVATTPWHHIIDHLTKNIDIGSFIVIISSTKQNILTV